METSCLSLCLRNLAFENVCLVQLMQQTLCLSKIIPVAPRMQWELKIKFLVKRKRVKRQKQIYVLSENNLFKAFPWLKHLGAVFSPRRPGFNLRMTSGEISGGQWHWSEFAPNYSVFLCWCTVPPYSCHRPRGVRWPSQSNTLSSPWSEASSHTRHLAGLGVKVAQNRFYLKFYLFIHFLFSTFFLK